MKNWHVIYVESCTQKLKSFKTKKKAKEFIQQYELQKCDDDWIDLMFKSKKIEVNHL